MDHLNDDLGKLEEAWVKNLFNQTTPTGWRDLSQREQVHALGVVMADRAAVSIQWYLALPEGSRHRALNRVHTELESILDEDGEPNIEYRANLDTRIKKAQADETAARKLIAFLVEWMAAGWRRRPSGRQGGS